MDFVLCGCGMGNGAEGREGILIREFGGFWDGRGGVAGCVGVFWFFWHGFYFNFLSLFLFILFLFSFSPLPTFPFPISLTKHTKHTIQLGFFFS